MSSPDVIVLAPEKRTIRGCTDFDEALRLTHRGAFHWCLLLACGLANAANAIEILCISFVLPAAESDMKLTNADKGYITSIMFVGMLIGGGFWGVLGDIRGRRKALIACMTINGIVAILASLVTNKFKFAALRLLTGFGVGGSIPLIWAYFAEFHESRTRGRYLCMLASSWMIGNIVVAVVALAIMPSSAGQDPSLKGEACIWRVLVAYCSVPSLLAALAIKELPESPRHLLCTRRSDKEAVAVLARMFEWNTGLSEAEYPVKQIIDTEVQEMSDKVGPSPPASTTSSPPRQSATVSWISEGVSTFATEYGSRWWQNFVALLSPPFRYVMIVVLLINFAVQFGFYGLWLWLPDMFAKIVNFKPVGDSAPVTTSMCDVIMNASSRASAIANISTEDVEVVTDQGTAIDADCDEPLLAWQQPTIYVDALWLAFGALPANIATIWTMDRIGRRFFLMISCFLSAVSVAAFYGVTRSSANVALAIIFSSTSTATFNAMDCLATELFPTHLRSTAMSMTLVPARMGAAVGNLVFGFSIGTACSVPLLTVAFSFVAAALAAVVLPAADGKYDLLDAIRSAFNRVLCST